MKEYKLLVLDVDGTLLNGAHEITPRTRDTLIKIQQMGVRIVLASGRSPHGLNAIVRQLDMHRHGGYVIAFNGSLIYDAQTEEVLFERCVSPELLPFLERKAHQYGFPIFTYSNEAIITDTPNQPRIMAEAELNGLPVRHEELFSIQVDFAPWKLVLVNEDEASMAELYERWKRRLSGTAEVHRSEKFFLEILPPAIDKSMALGALLQKLDVKAEDVAAIGDGVRDIGLLQMAGVGIAMGNAAESVRACADFITDTNDRDGVAKAVEQAIDAYRQPENLPLEEINRMMASSMIGHLGITFTYAAEGRVEATMPVDLHTRQPFGILHGGASLALAETVAGLGSMLCIAPDEHAVGMQISGNHVSSAHEGDTVRAVATLVHKGRHSHLWSVDISTSTGKLVSTVRVLNSILRK